MGRRKISKKRRMRFKRGAKSRYARFCTGVANVVAAAHGGGRVIEAACDAVGISYVAARERMDEIRARGRENDAYGGFI
jgi:hypothetical protein